MKSDALASFLSTSKGYMMETSTAAIVDGKMEPMQSAPITQQLVITGQALYDTFVGDSQENVSKMDLIRGLVGKADALQIKGACDKLVEIAKTKDAANGVPDKVIKDGKEVVNRGPKTQSAMNTRTVIQQAWGALIYAKPQLDALGYKDTTGYQDMRILAKKALDAAKRDWKGDLLKSDADKERMRLAKLAKAETGILVQVQKDNPPLVGETPREWNERTFKLAEDAMEKAKLEGDATVVTAEFERITKGLSENQLFLLTKMLIENSPFEFTVTENEQEPETA